MLNGIGSCFNFVIEFRGDLVMFLIDLRFSVAEVMEMMGKGSHGVK